MRHVVVWERIDLPGMEYAEVELDPVRIEGEVVLLDEGTPCALSYAVECDDSGATSRAVIRFRRRGARTERVLARDASARWTVDWAPVPQLKGLVDVDVQLTPSTNTLPIRRLRLAAGQGAEVVAAWVRFPSLDVVPLRQAYRRVSATGYEYRALDSGFTAPLECDEHGIVTRYGGLWVRRG